MNKVFLWKEGFTWMGACEASSLTCTRHVHWSAATKPPQVSALNCDLISGWMPPPPTPPPLQPSCFQNFQSVNPPTVSVDSGPGETEDVSERFQLHSWWTLLTDDAFQRRSFVKCFFFFPWQNHVFSLKQRKLQPALEHRFYVPYWFFNNIMLTSLFLN